MFGHLQDQAAQLGLTGHDHVRREAVKVIEPDHRQGEIGIELVRLDRKQQVILAMVGREIKIDAG